MKPNTQNNQFLPKVLHSLKEFILLVCLSLLAPLCLYLDVTVLKGPMTESSFTESLQALLLFFSVICLIESARKYFHLRGFLVLMAGFFLCMLIRELDAFLDSIWHGFWLLPAILTAALACLIAVKFYRSRILEAMSFFIQTRPYYYMLFGLVVVIVFSRVFGSGSLLWKHILGANYDPSFKNSLQEGLELFGYPFIAYSSCIVLKLGAQWNRELESSN